MARHRVAFDATSLLGHRTGVGTVASELLTRLAPRQDLAMVAFAVTWRGRSALGRDAPPGVEIARRPVPARLARALWARVAVPPVEWLAGRCDVVHGPNFVVPPSRRAARLVTVHDLTCVHFPELCTRDTRAYPALLRRAIAAGATVHAVSEHVAGEVRDAFDVEPSRVVAIPNGVSPLPEADPARGTTLAGGSPYLLTLGTVEPRKDLPTAVAAFDHLAAHHADLRLVIAGPDGWGAHGLDAARDAAVHSDRIVRLGWIEPGDRAALLRGAAALLHTARYEGFGLTPLEAMSASVPVVATAAGAVPEVVGDAALLAPVGDAEALSGLLEKVLSEGDLRAELVRRGHERVRSYSWDTAADDLAALYHRLAEG